MGSNNLLLYILRHPSSSPSIASPPQPKPNPTDQSVHTLQLLLPPLRAHVLSEPHPTSQPHRNLRVSPTLPPLLREYPSSPGPGTSSHHLALTPTSLSSHPAPQYTSQHTSPAVLDASFHSICTAQNKLMPVNTEDGLRIPASFEAFSSNAGDFRGNCRRCITSQSWTSKINSQNFKKSFKSEHRVENAIARGMVVCSIQLRTKCGQLSPFRTHEQGQDVDKIVKEVRIALLSTTNLSTTLSQKEPSFSRVPHHLRNLCKIIYKSSESAWSEPVSCREKVKKKQTNMLRTLSQFFEGAQARRCISELRIIADESLCGAARAAMLELIDLWIYTEHRDDVSVSQQTAGLDYLENVSSNDAKACEEKSRKVEYSKIREISHSNGVISSCRAVEVLQVKYGFASEAVMQDKPSYICLIAAANKTSHSSPSSFSKLTSNAGTPLVAFGGTGALGLITAKHAVQLHGYTTCLQMLIYSTCSWNCICFPSIPLPL